MLIILTCCVQTHSSSFFIYKDPLQQNAGRHHVHVHRGSATSAQCLAIEKARAISIVCVCVTQRKRKRSAASSSMGHLSHEHFDTLSMCRRCCLPATGPLGSGCWSRLLQGQCSLCRPPLVTSRQSWGSQEPRGHHLTHSFDTFVAWEHSWWPNTVPALTALTYKPWTGASAETSRPLHLWNI